MTRRTKKTKTSGTYNYEKIQFPKGDDTIDRAKELALLLTEEDEVGRRCCVWQAVKVAVEEAIEARA